MCMLEININFYTYSDYCKISSGPKMLTNVLNAFRYKKLNRKSYYNLEYLCTNNRLWQNEYLVLEDNGLLRNQFQYQYLQKHIFYNKKQHFIDQILLFSWK